MRRVKPSLCLHFGLCEPSYNYNIKMLHERQKNSISMYSVCKIFCAKILLPEVNTAKENRNYVSGNKDVM